MGHTFYPDTNNQYAYRTDRHAFLKRLKDKAEVLWIEGYRAMVSPDAEPHTFFVWQSADGFESGYKVNPVTQTCTCKFMQDQETYPLDPDRPGKRIACKHLRGVKALVEAEIGYFKGLERTARHHPHNAGSCERAADYAQQWSALDTVWNEAARAWHNRRQPVTA